MFPVLVVTLLLPMLLISVGIAALPWQPMWLRIIVLAVHLVATVVAIVVLPGRFEVWMMTLGPGAAVALFRGFGALRAVSATRAANSTET